VYYYYSIYYRLFNTEDNILF